MEELVNRDGTFKRRQVVIHLVGGPCDDVYVSVLGFGRLCWQRVPGHTPFWACYAKNLHERGEYTFTGEIIGLVEMASKIAAQGRGNVQGSYGA